jgi:serine protease Do
MIQKLLNYLKRRPYRSAALGMAGLSLLLVGFLTVVQVSPRVAFGEKYAEQAPHPSVECSTIPSSFANLAQKLGPTVVNIKVTKVEKAGFEMPQMPEGPFGDFFKKFFKDMPQGPENFQTEGAGSGVIISKDGYILTNNHVVEGAKEVVVTLGDKKEYKARIVGRDPKTDLAVLKIDAGGNLPAAPMGNSDKLKVGDWVLAIGNPFGLSHTVTSGIVSAKGRVIGAGPYDDFIQTDASINPGNSGGPLFNMEGEMVGINTAILPYGQGIGFAIPINTAKPLIPQLVATGEVTRGYLGVSIQPITPELAKALKLEDTKGALVGEVMSESPADKAGVKRGDVIKRFNNETVEGARQLSAMVAQTEVGKETTMTVLRDGAERTLNVEIGKLVAENEPTESSPKPVDTKWGLQLQDVDPQMAAQLDLESDHGVVVVGVEPGSPAQNAGIQQGDMILEVNRQPVSSVQETKNVISKAEDKDHLLLLVSRDKADFFVALAG